MGTVVGLLLGVYIFLTSTLRFSLKRMMHLSRVFKQHNIIGAKGYCYVHLLRTLCIYFVAGQPNLNILPFIYGV